MNHEKLKEMKRKIKSELKRRKKVVRPKPEPRYDDLYWEGTEWLDKQ